jgi:hypothetical protein
VASISRIGQPSHRHGRIFRVNRPENAVGLSDTPNELVADGNQMVTDADGNC